MRKMIGVMALLCLTGCACTSKKKADLFRTALKDTNASLTQCREDNRQKSEMLRRQHTQIVALKKQRRQLGK